jgi:SOS-response transcriptional repressor LexA
MTGSLERDDLLDCLVADLATTQSNRAYENDHFAEWLTQDAVSHRSNGERAALERAADDFAVALTHRVTAARMAKKYPRYSLHQRRALVSGTFAQTGALAALERCAPRVDLRVAAGMGRELWDEVCDMWVELPAGLPRGHYVALTVSGDSMTPLLHDGDVILVQPRAKVTRDSVIVARRPEDGYVVKHVARVGRAVLELASLNPAYAPFTVARDPGSVVGVVVARFRGVAEAQAEVVSANPCHR